MADPADAFAFGPFTLSIAQRSLRRDGVPLTLGSRAFDLLVALVERGGRVVAKDELLDVVWGRVVVEESNLHVHVSALRKLLGPDLITTLPGRGYQFNLPAPPTPAARAGVEAHCIAALVGREDDQAALQRLLARHALVTITGPGGIGKTRLARAALDAAASLQPDGVATVELAALNQAASVPHAIAGALQLPLGAVGDPLAALATAARPLRMLVLLDNAEHLVDGVALAAQALLAPGSALRLIVTSQVPLKVADEQVYRLSGLAVPDAGLTDPEEALRCGALALFDQRVRAADRRFGLTPANLAAAISICSQLDGIALAIELAAARCPLLGVQGVADRLGESLRLLRSASRSAPSRHQTLLAAMDWSHGLLTPGQAAAFRQLGVFVGGFSLPMATGSLQVQALDEWGTIDLLTELVDRSLVDVDDAHDTPRYRLLETARAYALARLVAAGEEAGARQRHARALRALFEQATEDCWQLPEAEFIARYEPDLDNLRAALDWAVQHDPETAVALAGSSSRLWRGLSLHPEALRRFEQARRCHSAGTPPAIMARLWEGIAQLSGETSSPESRSAAQQAETLYAQAGDPRGQYLALAHLAFSYRSATPEAQAAFARMQALEDPRWPPAVRLYGRKVEGGLASDAGRIAAARAANQARLALAAEAGSERDTNAALGNLAEIALMGGDAAGSVRLNRELLARLGRRHRTTRTIALGNLLPALLTEGLAAEARDCLAEFVDLARQLNHMFVVYSADSMAWLAGLEGRWDDAGHLLAYADAAYAAEGQDREPNEASARARALALLTAEGVALPPVDPRIDAEAACAMALRR